MASRTSDARQISRVRTVMSNDQNIFNLLIIINKKDTNHKRILFLRISRLQNLNNRKNKKIKSREHVL